MFTHKGTRRSNGLTLTTLAYREQPGPDAFVYNLDMQPAAVSGEIVIEQGTGRIHKTLLEIQMTSVKAVLTTEYAPAASVNLLVPTVFRELYESGVESLRQRRPHLRQRVRVDLLRLPLHQLPAVQDDVADQIGAPIHQVTPLASTTPALR